MKKIVVLGLLVIMAFIISKTAYATTTFSMDRTNGDICTTYNSSVFSTKTNSDVFAFNFAYIKKFKIDIDYQTGKYSNKTNSLDFNCFNMQIGLPIVNKPKQILYITLGGMSYFEDTNLMVLPEHEADGGMLGIDLVVILSNKFQIELNIQHSLRGKAVLRYYDIDFGTEIPLYYETDLSIYKVKLRYLLTDNFGLTLNYRSMENNSINNSDFDNFLKFCTLGFVYRF